MEKFVRTPINFLGIQFYAVPPHFPRLPTKKNNMFLYTLYHNQLFSCSMDKNFLFYLIRNVIPRSKESNIQRTCSVLRFLRWFIVPSSLFATWIWRPIGAVCILCVTNDPIGHGSTYVNTAPFIYIYLWLCVSVRIVTNSVWIFSLLLLFAPPRLILSLAFLFITRQITIVSFRICRQPILPIGGKFLKRLMTAPDVRRPNQVERCVKNYDWARDRAPTGSRRSIWHARAHNSQIQLTKPENVTKSSSNFTYIVFECYHIILGARMWNGEIGY